ncbi:hypothetical protein [Sinorhizobium sp. RAC02]|uniref:hypothetical protein n=1 Tax=Sinorhizobium sp. RAC02 TaxID=1842534 RepID=UPI002570EB89|nr:hypothetical protein [Sinorhizobium sp. RAC02]
MNGRLIGKELSFAAAAHRFPHAELAIRRLMNHSEAFCDLCQELAEAKAALSRVAQTTPEDLREERTREWLELIDLLVAELREALGLGRRKPGQNQ